MNLAAAALGVVREALVSGAVAQPGAAGPKAAGAPGGVLVTVLAAKVVHNLATAGKHSGFLTASFIRVLAGVRLGHAQAWLSSVLGPADLLVCCYDICSYLSCILPKILFVFLCRRYRSRILVIGAAPSC
jgi:hypothetical protein